MLKKRLIFVLLYLDGFFVQSRNFRPQKVGDVNWLKQNYNFDNISKYIDELIILNISRKEKNFKKFFNDIQLIIKSVFLPISLGGGIRDLELAKECFNNGADKIVLNTIFTKKKEEVEKISSIYGEQSIIASIDIMKNLSDKNYSVYTDNGKSEISKNLLDYIEYLREFNFGEYIINSIDRDGTGRGYEEKIIKIIEKKITKPLIISGGCGKANHLLSVLQKDSVSAASTSNLLNFIGDGLKTARITLKDNGIEIPNWQYD